MTLLWIALSASACLSEISLASRALQGGEARRAAEILEPAATKCPSSPEVFDLLGISSDLLGRTSQAQQAFRRAIELDPRAPRPRTNLATSLMREGKESDALSELETAVRLEPSNAAANANLGAIFTQRREYERALRYFEAAGGEKSAGLSADPRLLVQLAECLLATGRQKRALDLLPAPSARHPASLRFSLGVLLARNGLYREAIVQLESIPGSDADAAVCFNLGLAHSRLRRHAAARRWYFAAIDRDPQHADAYFHVGLDYAESGDGPRAIPWFFRARRMDPRRAEILYALSEELIAGRYFQTAGALLADSAGTPLLETAKGDCELGQHRIAEAESHYRRALELDPSLAAGTIGLARALAAAEKRPEALEELRRLLAREPANTTALAEAGRLELESGDWKAALGRLERAWTADPGKTQVGLDLARCYRRSGQPGRALELLLSLRVKGADGGFYYYELARVYTDLKRPADAEREMREVQRIEKAGQEALRFVPPAIYIH